MLPMKGKIAAMLYSDQPINGCKLALTTVHSTKLHPIGHIGYECIIFCNIIVVSYSVCLFNKQTLYDTTVRTNKVSNFETLFVLTRYHI